ncbi:hypothetical protein [Aquabacterium parvum]|uniref:hypothetical protein n=1 Tax=Aquabacterium parvum TaxID=70584 RepID=UPI000718DBF8|nr:hypothetical protein [Aquabacterium parvum]
MALKLDLKPEQRARIERVTCEVLRLYALTPRWLARYLLTTARDLRRFCAWGPMDCVYDARLLWQLIPELAYRLGETRFLADERIDGEVRCMSDDMLRCQVLMALRNVSIHAYWHSPSAHVFFHEVANGNPVVFGVDPSGSWSRGLGCPVPRGDRVASRRTGFPRQVDSGVGRSG